MTSYSEYKKIKRKQSGE